MADLIDRKELLEQMQTSWNYLDDSTMLTMQNIVECLPPADTERHAHWIDKSRIINNFYFPRFVCSNCGYDAKQKYEYCTCGCKMNGGDTE